MAVVCVASHSAEPRMNLVAVDLSSEVEVGELWDGEGTSILEAICVPDPARHVVAATSDRTGSARALIWDIDNGDRVDVDLPGVQGDVVPVAWSAHGDRLLLQESWRAVDSLWLHDDRNRRAHQARPPVRNVRTGELRTGRRDPRVPRGRGRAGARGHARWPVGCARRRGAGGGRRAAVHAVAVRRRRGREAATRSRCGCRCPTGWGRSRRSSRRTEARRRSRSETYVPRAQAWTDHGYAYASVNYHGSWGFGRAFLESIWGHPGELEIDDMVAARAWLIAQGIAEPAAVLVTGWSYGGYLTLQAMGTRPDLWAGGMAGVAIGDWSLMYRDGSDALKAYQVGLLGGLPEERPDVYRAVIADQLRRAPRGAGARHPGPERLALPRVADGGLRNGGP